MKYVTTHAVLSASMLLLGAPSTLAFYPLAFIGCYKSVSSYENNGSFRYQSTGYCSTRCTGMKLPYMALTAGDTCFCGSAIPSNSELVNKSECNMNCTGYPQNLCGGSSVYDVWADGLVQYTSSAPPNPTLPSSTSTAAVITEAGKTVVVTATGSTSASQNSSSNHSNTAGIAAGVVVGIVGLSAIVGATIFILRRRRNKAIEEEYRRNAALNNFIDSSKKSTVSGSMAESRWDGDFMAERRQSNGSIADDQDFSRRILQVTNPDR